MGPFTLDSCKWIIKDFFITYSVLGSARSQRNLSNHSKVIMTQQDYKMDPYLALENIPTGIFILRLESRNPLEFRNIYVNETDSEIVGTDLKPFMGKTLRETFPSAYDHGFPEKYLEALDTGKKVKIGEVQYGDQTVNDQTFFLEVVPLDDKTVMLTTENISSLRKAQATLELKNISLEAKNQELEELMYVVSHDLKSPLGTILGTINYLKYLENEIANSRIKEGLEFIEQSGKRMRGLIKDILDYAVIGNERKQSEVDCNKLLRDVLSDLKGPIDETGAVIETGDLPVITGLETEIRQLFQNLISNALKFRSPDMKPEIRINASEQGGKWEFSFRDNGIGISKENQKKIFQAFKRLHGEDRYPGTGIGLANCKKIAELHQGSIRVESVPGKGSIFYVIMGRPFGNR